MFKMLAFLHEIMDKARLVVLPTDLHPQEEVAEGEEVIGRIENEETMRLYAILHRSAEEIAVKCEGVHPVFLKLELGAGTEKIEALKQHFLVHERHKLLVEIFWTAISHDFPQITMDTTGREIEVRKDWQIVFLPAKSKVSMLAFEP